MNRKTKDINESELKNWRLLKQFRKLFDGILKDRPRSKSEDDPRRQLHFLDYATSILFVFCNPVVNSMRGLCAAIFMYDHFGKMPTKRQMEMLKFYFMEFATYEELEEALAENKKD